MVKQKQGNRSLTCGVPAAATAQHRHRRRRHLGDNADPLTLEYRALIEQLAKSRGISLERFFKHAPEFAVSVSWLRDRYYGRAEVTENDLRVVRGDLEFRQDTVGRYRAAVKMMCLYCCAVDDLSEAVCWDGTCPLRPVSPVATVTQRPDPLAADDV